MRQPFARRPAIASSLLAGAFLSAASAICITVSPATFARHLSVEETRAFLGAVDAMHPPENIAALASLLANDHVNLQEAYHQVLSAGPPSLALLILDRLLLEGPLLRNIASFVMPIASMQRTRDLRAWLVEHLAPGLPITVAGASGWTPSLFEHDQRGALLDFVVDHQAHLVDDQGWCLRMARPDDALPEDFFAGNRWRLYTTECFSPPSLGDHLARLLPLEGFEGEAAHKQRLLVALLHRIGSLKEEYVAGLAFASHIFNARRGEMLPLQQIEALVAKYTIPARGAAAPPHLTALSAWASPLATLDAHLGAFQSIAAALPSYTTSLAPTAAAPIHAGLIVDAVARGLTVAEVGAFAIELFTAFPPESLSPLASRRLFDVLPASVAIGASPAWNAFLGAHWKTRLSLRHQSIEEVCRRWRLSTLRLPLQRSRCITFPSREAELEALQVLS